MDDLYAWMPDYQWAADELTRIFGKQNIKFPFFLDYARKKGVFVCFELSEDISGGGWRVGWTLPCVCYGYHLNNAPNDFHKFVDAVKREYPGWEKFRESAG